MRSKLLEENARLENIINSLKNEVLKDRECPDKKMYFPISRAIVKCEDGGLCLHKGRHSTQMPEEKKENTQPELRYSGWLKEEIMK